MQLFLTKNLPYPCFLIIIIGGVGVLSIQAVVSGAGDILMTDSGAQAVYDIASKWRIVIIVMSIAAVGLAMVEGFLLLPSIVNPIEKIAGTLTSGAEHSKRQTGADHGEGRPPPGSIAEKWSVARPKGRFTAPIFF